MKFALCLFHSSYTHQHQIKYFQCAMESTFYKLGGFFGWGGGGIDTVMTLKLWH